MSPCFSAYIHIYKLTWLTPEKISFHEGTTFTAWLNQVAHGYSSKMRTAHTSAREALANSGEERFRKLSPNRFLH